MTIERTMKRWLRAIYLIFIAPHFWKRSRDTEVPPIPDRRG